ncbi:hypothetical protein Pcac1_g23214 [Phytophthora cactorum]|nr:hypothetical protein Pcac1_g23214 [Phytophthora cactorum]
MKDQTTKALAMKLQSQRFEDWKHSNTDPLKVFAFLKLDKHDILTNPGLTSWFNYLDDFNARKPSQGMTRMEALSNGLNDRGLAKVLEAGMQGRGKTKAIATKLEKQLFAEWEAKQYTPDHIFRAVGLKNFYGDATGPILSDPVLKFWVRYMNEFNTKHPDKRTTIFETLRKNYGDEALVGMLVATKKAPKTKTAAKSLESQLLRKWLRDGLQPKEVVLWMNKDKSGEILNTYTRLFQAKWPNSA